LGHSASPRFPSPLIERSVRISRTTLADWLHRKAHDEARVRSRMSGGRRLRLAAELLPTAPGTSGVCRLSPITMPSPSSEAHQKSGSFPPPALPGLSSTMTLSDTRRSRRPATTSRPLPSPTVGLPQLPGSPFRHAVPTTPMDQNRCFCRLLPHPTRAFPGTSAGRRPSLHFRGLLRLHSCYGLPDCSTAQGGFCHEASTRPVARPCRSSATRAYRQLSGWFLPPLVNRAVGAHDVLAERWAWPDLSELAPTGTWIAIFLRVWATSPATFQLVCGCHTNRELPAEGGLARVLTDPLQGHGLAGGAGDEPALAGMAKQDFTGHVAPRDQKRFRHP